MDAELGQQPGSRQYFLGDALLVAPVTTRGECVTATAGAAPATIETVAAAGSVGVEASRSAVSGSSPPDAPCGLALTDTWTPPGLWFEIHSGKLLQGPASRARVGVHLLDTPVYAKGGAVVPRRPLALGATVGLAAKAYEAIEWTIYPGAPSGSGTVYEDDGETYGYLHGASAVSSLAYVWTGGNTLHVSISASVSGDGSYAHQLHKARTHSIRLPNVLPPLSVMVAGTGGPRRLAFARSAAPTSWHYNGDDLAAVVTLPAAPATEPLNFTITFAPSTAPSMVSALDGIRGKMAAARRAKATLNQRRMAPGEHSSHVDPRGAPLAVVASTPERCVHNLCALPLPSHARTRCMAGTKPSHAHTRTLHGSH